MTIKDQILQAVGTLTMTTRSVGTPQFRGSLLNRFLTCKEVRIIPEEKKAELFSWEPSVLFPDFQDFWENGSDDELPGKDYIGLTDGYNVSELFANVKRFRVTPDYMKFIRNTKNGMVVNVYHGTGSSMLSTKIWNYTDSKRARKEFMDGKIPECSFTEPDEVNYTEFGKPTYWDYLLIESCRNDITVLAIDLPFDYYSAQNLQGNIFTWDLKTKEYQVGGKSLNKFNARVQEVAAHGFGEPLVMRINEGCLTPIDDRTAVDLFVATYLGLPTIPAVLYMSDEEVMKNELIEELYEVAYSNYWENPAAMDEINRICKPYFVFEIAKDSESRGFLQVGTDYYNKTQYPSVNDINDPDAIVFDRHLDTSVKAEEVLLPMDDEEIKKKMQLAGEELMEQTIKDQERENERIAQQILNGEY